MFVCEVCKKEYQSKSGLRRHVKSKHRVAVPILPLPIDLAGGDEETEVAEAGGGPASERSEDRPLSDRPACSAGRRPRGPWLPNGVTDKEAKTACKELGIKQADVMAYKVYHEVEPLKVVIIEGPVGQKRVWLAK